MAEGLFGGMLESFDPTKNVENLAIANTIEGMIGQGNDATMAQSDNILKAFGGIAPRKRAATPSMSSTFARLQQANELQTEQDKIGKALVGRLQAGTKEKQAFDKSAENARQATLFGTRAIGA